MKLHWTSTSDEDDDDDGASKPALKPVIRELVRTGVHPPFLKLLVDKILVVPYLRNDGKKSEAYRVWLSDGEKIIQAALLRDVHPYFIYGQIREGSFVEVTKYKLARSKRLSGEGTILHLLVDDLHAFGHDGRPTPPIEDAVLLKPKDAANTTARDIAEASSDMHSISQEPEPEETTISNNISSDEDAVDLVPWYDEHQGKKSKAILTSEKRPPPPYPTKRTREESPSPLQPVSPNVKQPSKHPHLSHKPASTLADHSTTSPTTSSSPTPHRPSTVHPSPPALLPITRPLRLQPLAHITGARATRNKVVDVFAVVASVTATLVKCPGMPDGIHYKRELRITDPSTPKHVMLSVFVAPHAFLPAVGTVALFRSLTTNRWDSGSLNAFGRDCEGKCWFVPDPWNVPGCDVLGLRMWWLGKRVEEVVGKEDVEALLPVGC
ncbi:hypothetical protein MMC26_000550 [Xylographa opegraphella]|nr:hypothetical protein [Xylographa opegraphella]